MCGVPAGGPERPGHLARVYLGWLDEPYVFCPECAERESAAGFTARRRLLCLNSRSDGLRRRMRETRRDERRSAWSLLLLEA